MPKSGAPRSRRWDRLILIGTAVVTIGMTALTAWTIEDAHRVRSEHAIQTSENLTAALGHDIQRNLEIYDLSLRNVIDGLNQPDLAHTTPAVRDRALFDGAASAEGLGAILVVDDTGRVMIDSRATATRHGSLADRDYFTFQRDHPNAGLYLGAPSRSRTDGIWVMAMSRRFNHPDGSFAGVVVGFLRLVYFQKLFEKVDLGANGTATLFLADGRILMRVPFDVRNLTMDVHDADLFKQFARAPAGHFEAMGLIDKLPKLYVYQHLGNLPLILSVGAATKTIFAEWQQKAIFTAAATLGLLGILAFLAIVSRRELRRAERADALLREAVESISAGFVIFDAKDRLVMCNDAYRTIYPKNAPLMIPGNTFEEILRAGIYSGQSPDAAGQEEAWVAERMRAHLNPVGPHEHRLWNGRWVLTSERRMPSGGIAGLRIDITPFKEIQASLRESQAALVRAQRVSSTGSVIKNFATGKAEWSDQAYRIFGVDRETFSPNRKTFFALVHPDDRALVAASIAASERGIAPGPLQYRILRPDGELRWVYREAEIILDAHGTPVGRVSTYKDVTEQHLAKLRQEELEAQLRHSQKLEALGTLAGGIAHDLNNTLVPILALSKLGLKRTPANSPEYHDLEIIARASEQARDLVKQILAFSRKQGAQKQRLSIAPVVREAMQMLRATIPTTIRLVEHIDDVPATLADASQLHQIVTNLVTNAAHAIGDHLGTVTITLGKVDAARPRSRDRRAEIRLSVADTGCGIDQSVLDRIFEPFFTTKEVGQGSGLGLAVVHGIVTGHGGRITCTSKVGEGSEFVVTLPVTDDEEASPAIEPAA